MRDAPILAFDVGGSFVKAGLVNLATGTVAGEVLRRPTPDGATPCRRDRPARVHGARTAVRAVRSASLFRP